MPNWVYILVLLFTLFAISFYLSDKNDDRKMNNLFSCKPRRTDEDYYKTYFKDTKIPEIVVSRVRTTFEELLHEDLKALEADDDFATDYSAI